MPSRAVAEHPTGQLVRGSPSVSWSNQAIWRRPCLACCGPAAEAAEWSLGEDPIEVTLLPGRGWICLALAEQPPNPLESQYGNRAAGVSGCGPTNSRPPLTSCWLLGDSLAAQSRAHRQLDSSACSWELQRLQSLVAAIWLELSQLENKACP